MDANYVYVFERCIEGATCAQVHTADTMFAVMGVLAILVLAVILAASIDS